MEDVECEPDSSLILLPNSISVQPHTKNEIYKTPDLKIKKLRKNVEFDIIIPPFITKSQPKIKTKKAKIGFFLET